MARYLDPKADVTFKKVFGEHKNLVISLLNALLPLEDGKKVESIEYLPSEPVPRTPTSRNTIGMAVETIAKYIGLPTEEIVAL